MADIKCGLEIHQQLATHKLFCECESRIVEDLSNVKDFYRVLSLSKSEIGEIDKAAMHEALKNKKFRYLAPPSSSCLVEMDEEPPHDVNQEALIITLQAARLLNARIIDEAQVMRKIVIDGSNTSGFQRTMLIATDGFIDTSNGKVRIETICLEEDAARKIEEKEGVVTYCLDRLGIPLIEIATAPDIKTPKQARETAEKIGLLLRSLKVKRGLGTIRQDINISIKGGARVEIKGAQDLRLIERIVELEARRQERIIEFSKKAERPDIGPLVDLTNIFTNTSSRLVSNGLKKGYRVMGFIVKNFKGLLGYELYSNKRIATEISDYIKTRISIGGLLHGDELPGYGISTDEIKAVKKELGVRENDNYVLFIETEEKCVKARELFIERLSQLVKGVPSEVRRANPDGSTTFMRPMPGSARMYPETDIRPIVLRGIEVETPRTIFELVDEYKSLGLPEDLAMIAAKERIPLRELAEKYKLDIKTVARILVYTPRMVKTKTGKECVIEEEKMHELLRLYSQGLINRQGVEALLEEYATKHLWNPDKYKPLSRKEIEKILEEILKKTKNRKEIMRIISSYGNIDPRIVIEILKERGL